MRLLVPLSLAVAALVGLAFWLLAASEPRREAPAPPPIERPVPSEEADAPAQLERVEVEVPEVEEIAFAEPPDESDLVLEEEQEVLFEEGEAPPDPIERGACSLAIALWDPESGAPVDGSVTLWRIDAPANDDWGRGDQEYAQGRARDGNVTFHELAEGTYRLVLHEQRRDRDDPPAFEVAGAWTHVTLEVERARATTVYLTIFDETGRRLEQARWGDPTTNSSPLTPPWQEHRPLLDATLDVFFEEWSMHSSSYGSLPTHTAGPRGFAVGPFGWSTRSSDQSYELSVLCDGGARILLEVDGDRCAEEIHLAAVSIPADPLRAHVALADGRSLEDERGALLVRCTPIEWDPDTTRDVWLDIPLTIHVDVPGHQELEFEHRVRDGAPPLRVLEPRIP